MDLLVDIITEFLEELELSLGEGKFYGRREDGIYNGHIGELEKGGLVQRPPLVGDVQQLGVESLVPLCKRKGVR